MGRLIDAEALLENQPKGCYRTSDWINDAPTVDAIPVDWLQSCIKIAELFGDERNAGLLTNLIDLWHRDGYGFFEKRTKED